MTERSGGRRSGILMPLFSCPRTTGWGIGDISDLEAMTAWLAAAGQRVLQLLPINEMAPGQQSPYSAISAMAIDPIFIDVAAVPEFAAIGGEASLSLDDRARLDRARRSPSIDYGVVRQLKRQALRSAYERFVDLEWHRKTARATALTDFVAEQAWWIEEYSLFRAVHAAQDERPWTEWPPAVSGPARGSGRRTSGSRQQCPIPSVRAVDRAHAVATGARADAWRGAVRRLAVHGGRRQRRRLGAPASVSSRRLAWRTA
jgi:4-alpha-glucanotransferase